MAVHSYKEGKWRIRFMVAGKRIQRVVDGTKQEALELEAALRLQLRRKAGRATEPERKTARNFSDFCLNEYKAYCLRPKKGQAPSTYHRKTKYMLATLIEVFGDLNLDQITTELVEDFADYCLEVRVLKPSYINGLLTTLGAILRRARTLKVAASDPEIDKVDDVEMDDDDSTKGGVWTREEIVHLLETAKRVRPAIYPLLLFLANTGCRKGEGLALRTRNVDAHRGRMHIRCSKKFKTKNRKNRTIPVPEDLRGWAYSLAGSDKEYVFNSSRGSRWAFFPTRQFNTVLKKAGLEGSPHKFRHSYATHLVLETRDLYLVSKMLGHSHTSVTQGYAHLLDEHLDRAREAFSIGVSRELRKDPSSRNSPPLAAMGR